jgi:hypothetical protein
MARVKALQNQAGNYGMKLTGDEWVVTSAESLALQKAGLVDVIDEKENIKSEDIEKQKQKAAESSIKIKDKK